MVAGREGSWCSGCDLVLSGAFSNPPPHPTPGLLLKGSGVGAALLPPGPPLSPDLPCTPPCTHVLFPTQPSPSLRCFLSVPLGQ